MQQIEIKRKFFDVIEKLGERSYKVSRKGDLYFLKDFGTDKSGFEDFVDRTNELKVTGVKSPKIYLYDKNSRIIVMDYIDGPYLSEIIAENDLEEEIIAKLFQTFWLAKIDKLYLEYRPGNFKLHKDNLVYIPFKYKKFVNNNDFLNNDLLYWFPTSKLEEYLLSTGLSFDHKRIKNEYLTNKQMTLMSIKYYK